jgi:hypothetical protein
MIKIWWFWKRKSVKFSKIGPFFQWKIHSISWNHIFVCKKFDKNSPKENHCKVAYLINILDQQCIYDGQTKNNATLHNENNNNTKAFQVHIISTWWHVSQQRILQKILVLGWLININYLHVIWKAWKYMIWVVIWIEQILCMANIVALIIKSLMEYWKIREYGWVCSLYRV